VGATAAVALHAFAQWWGAARVGVRLLPARGWRDAEVRRVLRRSITSIGVAALDAGRQMAVLPVANRVAGGVVAFQLALNFASLPVALGAKPVGVALLPQLARRAGERTYNLLRDDFVRGTSLACFVTIPSVVAYIALAVPLSHAMSYGAMATSAGMTAVAVSLVAIAPGIAGDGAFHVAAQAFYALRDVTTPLKSMVLRTGVSIGGIAVAWHIAPGTVVLVVLGLAISAGNMVSGADLQRRFLSRLPRGDERLGPSLLRSVAASLLMAGPAYAIAAGLMRVLDGRLGAVAGVSAACSVAGLAYAGAQLLWRSPDVGFLRGGLELMLRRRLSASRAAPSEGKAG